MKKRVLIPTILILAFGSSLFAVSDTLIKEEPQRALPSSVIALEKAIQTASYDPNERNSKLRYERAKQYYGYAINQFNASWHKQAIDSAERGLRLLEMNSANTHTSVNNVPSSV